MMLFVLFIVKCLDGFYAHRLYGGYCSGCRSERQEYYQDYYSRIECKLEG